MSFLTPTFLAFAALAAPIILLYMLRLRRREVKVSSSLLWQRLMRDREANAPWQRLRRNLLLLLQLLILAALVIALARPFVEVPSVASGNVALLLDASASMNATDAPAGSETRFEVAQTVALRLVSELAVDETMTVILVGATPRLLTQPGGDRAALRAAINNAAPTQGSADWAAAFALAAAGAQAGDDFSMVVVSDGGLPDDLPALPGEIRYVPVGQSSDNLAISALAARPTVDGVQLFAAITNYGNRDARVVFDLEVDGSLLSAQELEVAAGETENLTFSDLPPDAARIKAGLTVPSDSTVPDYLPLDDHAWAVFAPPGTLRVLLMSPGGNLFLEQLLVALPGVEGFRAAEDGSLPAEPFDIYIFDGILPAQLPEQGNLLIFNPPVGSSQLLTVSGTFENTSIVRVAANDPLLAFVDWEDVSIFDAQLVEVPSWARVLVEAEGGPLLVVGERGSQRLAVMTFDLRRSDLPLKVAFPILMSNLFASFSSVQTVDAQASLSPGQPMSIRLRNDTTTVVVIGPDGVAHDLPIIANPLDFIETDLPGLYEVALRGADESQSNAAFAVNLFAPEESNIGPRDSITLGQTAIGAAVDEEALGQRELWPWLAIAGLVLLIVEWYAYHRGVVFPDTNKSQRTLWPFGRRAAQGGKR